MTLTPAGTSTETATNQLTQRHPQTSSMHQKHVMMLRSRTSERPSVGAETVSGELAGDCTAANGDTGGGCSPRLAPALSSAANASAPS